MIESRAGKRLVVISSVVGPDALPDDNEVSAAAIPLVLLVIICLDSPTNNNHPHLLLLVHRIRSQRLAAFSRCYDKVKINT